MEGRPDYTLERPASDLSIPSDIFVTAGMTEGQISIAATVTDVAGNTKNAKEIQVTIDRTADKDSDFELVPSVMGAPFGTADLSENNLFSFSGDDDDKQKIVVTFKHENEPLVTRTLTAPDFTFPDDVLRGFGAGEVAVNATIYDAAGNTAQAAEVKIEIDLSADTEGDDFEIVLDIEDKKYNADEYTENSFTLSGFDSDIKNITIIFTQDGVTSDPIVLPSPFTVAKNIFAQAGLDHGEVKIDAFVTDNAGNTVNAPPQIIEIDTSADGDDRKLAIILDNPDGLYNIDEIDTKSFSIFGTDTDIETVVVRLTRVSDSTFEDFELNKPAWNVDKNIFKDFDGDIEISVTVTDTEGNTASAKPKTITIDKTADVDSDFEIGINSPDKLVNKTESTDLPIKLIGIDNDTKTIEAYFYHKDSPENKFTINITQTDDDTWVADNIDISSLDDGQIILEAIVTDNAGNTTVTTTDEFTLDKVAQKPISVSFEADISEDGYLQDEEYNAVSTVVRISLPNDAEAGNLLYVYDSKSELEKQYTLTEGDISNGYYEVSPQSPADNEVLTVRSYIVDSAGNQSETTTASIERDIKADRGQVLRVEIPESLENVSGDEQKDLAFSLVGVDNDIKDDGITVRFIDVNKESVLGQAIKNEDGFWVIKGDVSSLDDGDIKIEVTAEDKAGNTIINDNSTINKNIQADFTGEFCLKVDQEDLLVNKVESNKVEYDFENLDERVNRVKIVVTDSTGKNKNEVEGKVSLFGDKYFDISEFDDGEITFNITFYDEHDNKRDFVETITLDKSVANEFRLAASSDAGFEDDDERTNDTTPTFTGITDKDGKISLTINGKTHTNIIVNDETGEWSFTLPEEDALNIDGPYEVNVHAEDRAGNTKNAEPVTFELETTLPENFNNSGILEEDDTGISQTDEITSERQPSFSGTVEAGCRVTLYIDGKEYPATVNGEQWEVTVTTPLAENKTHTYQVVAMDVFGNTSVIDQQTLIIDTKAPDITSSIEPSADKVLIENTTNDVTPSFRGTLSDQIKVASVQMYFNDNGTEREISVSLNEGKTEWTADWLFDALTHGDYQYRLVAADEAGNSESYNFNFSVDLRAEVTVDLLSDTGTQSLKVENITNVEQPAIGGRGDPDSSIVLTYLNADGGEVTQNVAVNSVGDWSYTITDPLGEGNNTITVTLTDPFGNEDVAELNFILDTTPPAELNYALDADTGSDDNDYVTSNPKVEISNLESGAFWEYSLDAGVTWTKGQGTFFNVPDGTYITDQVQLRHTDKAGNNAVSKLPAITIDKTVEQLNYELEADTGSNTNDKVTSNPTIEVSNLEAGASWQYSLDSGATWQTGQGTTFDLAEGVYVADQIQLRHTDRAGNSEDTLLPEITIDNTVANLTYSLREDTGEDSSDNVTSNPTIDIANLEAGATWEYSLDSGVTWVTGQNTSFNVPEGEYGANEVQIRHIDKAGNVVDTKLAAITIDTTVERLTFSLRDDTGSSASDKVTSNSTIDISNLEQGASWQYSLDAGETWITGQGTSFTLPEGVYATNQIQLRHTDKTGNVADTLLPEITIDKTVENLTYSLREDTGDDTNDNVTSNPTIDIANLEADATWEYSLDSGVTWITGQNTSFNVPEGEYGANEIQIRHTDKAGNVVDTKLAAITIDTSVERLTFSLKEDTGSSASDKVTSNSQIEIDNLEQGASWQYSLDSGATWQAGQGTSFDVPEGVYAADQIQLRQTDEAGNKNDTKLPAITIDKSVTEVSVDVKSKDGSSGDYNTRDGIITVSGVEAGGSWEYSIDGGNTWLDGASSNQFTLPNQGSYSSGNIQVKHIDLAGNSKITIYTNKITYSDLNVQNISVENDTVAEGSANALSWKVEFDGQNVGDHRLNLQFTGINGFDSDDVEKLEVTYLLNGQPQKSEVSVSDISNIEWIIPDKAEEATFKLYTKQDTTLESNESISLSASVDHGGTLIQANKAATINDDDDVSIQGSQDPNPADFITNSETPTFEGEVEPGATVSLSVNGEFVDSDVADSLTGSFSIKVDDPLTESNHTYSLSISYKKDVDGVLQDITTEKTGTFEVDTTPPPILLDSDDLNEGDSSLGGSGYTGNDIGATVKLLKDGQELGSTTIKEDGSWEINDPNYSQGDQVTISIEDIAGNTNNSIHDIG
ncbi:Ig-like domain-containing protein [Veronia pacifica]|uniref:Ig-like domain repeat protein n=2 Tax=Veronia pacifica TaxID=1080227 RepID=A0A1C3EKT2_9GAMM|nr:Ig-like domain-containing protein [Veronia pacifica]ODA33839.1 hypothetical protein A8L45_08405 [Veronia pacifica]